MNFEARLKEIDKSGKTAEIDAAIAIYERLVTARSICASLRNVSLSESALVAVFTALCDEVPRQRKWLGLDEKPAAQ